MKSLNEIVNELVTHVFKVHKVDVETIQIDSFDLDRVYINNSEYILRMWNIYEDGTVEYTLYKIVNHASMFIGNGRTRSSRRLVRLLQEAFEQ